MKNIILRVAALVLVIVMALSLCSCVEDKKEQLPKFTKEGYVNDFAAVLTEADAKSILAIGVELQKQTTAEVAVVTINSLDGKPIADYALELGREWGVGDKAKKNGVIVLLSKGDREVYVAVGDGLEGALPDSKTGRIIDNYGISYFQNGDFSAGLLSVYSAIVNEVYIEYGIQPPENYVPVEQLPQNEQQASAAEVGLSWLALLVVVALYIGIFGRRGGLFIFGSPRFFGGGHYRGGGSSGGFGGFGGGSFGGGGAGRKF